MIIATAGHIDHGKSTLVRALTGVDTDRLPEEKRRGISIDLGFAYWTSPAGDTLGFVDVPGHERFVRNMLAGVCAIDHVLLVVAADDGVMPQTLEHLAIVNQLGVAGGSIALTKCDRVPPQRVDEVRRQIAAMVAQTVLAGARIYPVVALRGEGVTPLRDALATAAAALQHDDRPRRNLRFVIDRAFSVAGSGTVVTGTVVDGSVAPGDRLLVSPAGTEVRVRAVQADGRPAPRASAGTRCALNLVGVGRAEVGRGHCVLHPSLHAPSRRLDVLVRLLDGDGGLAHWSAAHLHLGTADVMVRVAVRRGAKIPAGGEAWAQLVLEQPVSALYGDRFILRDPSARQTLGGGVVLDPWPPARRPQAAVRATQLAALAHTDPVRALAGLALCSPAGVDVAEFTRARNLAQADVTDMLRRAKLVSVGPVAVVQERLQAWIHTLEAEVDLQHQTQPQASGAELVALRKALSGSATGPVFDALLAMLTADGRVEVTSGYARRPGHASTGNSVDRQMWQIARARIDAAGHRGISVAQLACEAGLNERQLRDLLRRLATTGELVRVTQDRYYLRATMAGFAATAKDLAQASPTGRFSVADYRDRTGLGRALVIDVLETLDRLAITRRLGDARLVWKDYVPLLGPDWPAPSG